MANEAIKRYAESSQGDVVHDFTVADGTGIEKGAILALTDPNTAVLASATKQPIAGIAAREKIASDGRTRLGLHKKGIFDLTASGAITVGAAVQIADDVGTYPNHVMAAEAASAGSGAVIIGYALETAAAAEVIQVRVDL
jgi:hypothetical protein